MTAALSWRPFDRDELWRVVCQGSGGGPEDQIPVQVLYLGNYLCNREMGAQAMLVEAPYTDRHYLTEYQDYYATTLRPPPAKATRVHFFSAPFGEGTLLEWARRGADPHQAEELRREVQAHYLGFVVIRPVRSAPIGRTLLRAWRDPREGRQFGPPPVPHRVHLFGLTLKVHGVQFHQQDQAVGACATAAVWCALSVVMRRDGGRAPTPSVITARANERSPEHRAFPAVAGLTRQQMIGAISAMHYSPDVVKPSRDNPGMFLLIVKTYVRSGIPVVLHLFDEALDEGHAVTLVGYREEAGTFDVRTHLKSYPLRSRALCRVYAHDDRLGPYARMTLTIEDQEPTLSVQHPPEAVGMPEASAAVVSCALAPLYPKIRMSASDLVALGGLLTPAVVQLVGGAQKERVHLEPFFALGGEYGGDVLSVLPISPERASAALERLVLSRYVGVLRFWLDDAWILDAVVDPTDILRDSPRFGPLLACIPASEDHIEPLGDLIDRPEVLVG